jgi:HD superfamily phosphodiesterase
LSQRVAPILNIARIDRAYTMIVDEIAGVRIPDGKLAREVAQFVRDTERDFLFRHSTRVYFWGAMAGKRKGLTFDPELFYTAAMFHDVGLTTGFRESRLRFEVDGANAARDFLRSHGISEVDIERVWLAIALHTTPGLLQLDAQLAVGCRKMTESFT